MLTTAVLSVQNGQLAGVVGGSGGTNIIATAAQVFVNHFIVGMHPLAAVQHPRVYHKASTHASINYLNLVD
jgi:gamma-glutamyltranspeptidase/glutathione hydrolase/leukotriene-C4 hydrolase